MRTMVATLVAFALVSVGATASAQDKGKKASNAA